MSWTRLTSITTNNGSNIITVNSGSTTNIKVGDALLVEGFDLVEIEGVFANQLQINSPWDAPTQSNISAAVLPTFGDFNNAVEEIRKLRQVTTDNLDAMEKWWTQSNGTVAFQSYNGDTFEVRTAQEMDSSVKQIEEAGLESIAEMESQAQALMTDVTSFSYARTEADMEADREAAKRVFAGSGMIHSGKHYSLSPGIVNEGMWTFHDPADANRFYLGRSSRFYAGSSETELPVFNLNGISVALRGLNRADILRNELILPPAPRGTEVYDSATGVVIDYATEVDPKYGDVAANDNEAVARAFEGYVQNGDFRKGVDYWYSGGSIVSAENGILHFEDTGVGDQYVNIFLKGDWPEGQSFKLSGRLIALGQNTPNMDVEVAYGGTAPHTNFLLPSTGPFKRTFTVPANAGNSVQLRFRVADGGSADFTDISVLKTTQEVVTHPVDLVGLEWFLRPINEADPILYPNGIQQCKLTSVDGIATVENTFRPLTHFEVYPGDTTSRGRGFNILNGSLADAQLKQQFQKKSNNVCRMADGTIAQWTLSQRTIRGLGNGDWKYINPQTTYLAYQQGQSVPARCPAPRGNRDTYQSFISNSAVLLGTNTNLDFPSSERDVGIFTTRLDTVNGVNYANIAVNGECYLYVVATVPRLNQGAYHPSFNPWGARRFTRTNVVGNVLWADPTVTDITTKDCFINPDGLDGVLGYGSGSGYIGSNLSGHPDGKFFDGIYADGLNGIIDWRKPAYPTDTPEQAAKVLSKVENGTYRGREKLVKSKFNSGAYVGYFQAENTQHARFTLEPGGQGGSIDFHGKGMPPGTWVRAYEPISGTMMTGKVSGTNGYLILSTINLEIGSSLSHQTGTLPTLSSAVEWYFLAQESTGLTVDGEYIYTSVVGRPSNIIATLDLSGGWIGDWIPVIPDGTAKNYPTVREALTTPSQTYTTDNGSTWTRSATLPNGWNANRSTRVGVSYPATAIDVWQYTTFAKVTVPQTNAKVLNGSAGLGDLRCTQATGKSYGSYILESLLGKVGTSVSHVNAHAAALTSYRLRDTGEIEGYTGYAPTHSPVMLGAPDFADSPAVKFLPYQVSNNQECSLNFAFAELKHDGTDWGDNGQLPIASNVSTYTNDNGVLCLYGNHTLAIPYGFSKNRARPGTQEKGVDL